ncbi:hypothetical protein BN946_scf185007.g105 [Trametes cinnabarina]|uniref:Zn(2)-C6 fungal-type domain-containing protein n=1 Tax=Pycnoporus cinnabarinus TaxID=5643 RepID=A0A060SFQ0_PYCCI|nr:hypothetical protein BN946_scf185007.g105 [Trametes cinnabarina]
MSALSEASTPAQDAAPPSIDTQQLQQHNPLTADLQQQPQQHISGSSSANPADASRKRMSFFPARRRRAPYLPPYLAKAPSVRRACIACHAGKTRCSENLPCQSCLKRGIGNSCAYPDPDTETHQANQAQQPRMSASSPPNAVLQTSFPVVGPAQVPAFAAAAMGYPPPMQGLAHPHYYDYNNTFAASPASAPAANPPAAATTSSSSFRPAKRPRPLTEEEAAAITRNFTRGDFFVGSSAPVRIDPRLPVRLTLAEGDQVHFSIGETIV